MKRVQVVVAREVKVVLNTSNAKRHQWAKIVDAKTGAILHTGQTGYIRKVALGKYNALASL